MKETSQFIATVWLINNLIECFSDEAHEAQKMVNVTFEMFHNLWTISHVSLTMVKFFGRFQDQSSAKMTMRKVSI